MPDDDQKREKIVVLLIHRIAEYLTFITVVIDYKFVINTYKFTSEQIHFDVCKCEDHLIERKIICTLIITTQWV